MYIRGYEASLNGRTLEALGIFTELAERYPTESDALMYLGSANLARRNPAEAVRWLNRVVELDPGRKLAYNQLAYAHYQAGQYEEAIAAIDKYIGLAPDEPNPYDSRGDMLAGHGRIDPAIESYTKALEMKADFYPSAAKLGHMYILKQQYEKADSVYMVFFGEGAKEVRSAGRLYLSLIPLHQGKMREALRMIDRGLEIDEMERADAFPRASKHATKAMIYEVLGRPDSALREGSLAATVISREAPGMAPSYRAFRIRLLAQAGLMDASQDSVEALHTDMMAMDSLRLAPYWYARGWLAFAQGDTSVAISHLSRAREASGSFFMRYAYAVACLKGHRLGEAVDAFRQILGSCDEERMGELGYSVLAEYQLGLAYEASGWSEEAKAQYRRFLEFWGKGDSDIPSVRDARARLVALQTRV
jgi:tetratricopeptide (TPR) repeat protein